jgi:hypothetical protein
VSEDEEEEKEKHKLEVRMEKNRVKERNPRSTSCR